MITNDDGNDKGKFLTIWKRFSNAESLLIMNTTKEYVRRNGLLISDVCRGLRDIDDKKGRRYPLWEELGKLLKKDKKAIWHHANMKLMAEYGCNENRGWSDEDKARLKTLVDCHGNDWATIGRIMGRLDKTCNHTYRRITFVKKITGRFSMEEDMALIKAVREDRGIDENVPVQEMNVTGTKWSLVAAKMKNNRHSGEYHNHWAIIRSNASRATKSNTSNSIRDNGGRNLFNPDTESLKARLVWLECIKRW